MPPVRVFRSSAEAEVARAMESGDHLARLRRTRRRLVAALIVQFAAIAFLLVFIVRKISS